MATKVISGIADRLINSLKSLQKGEWFDAMATYQDYPIMRMAMSMGKERSGNKLSFRVGVGSENVDGHHGLYEDFDLDRPDVMTEGSLDWRNIRKGFAIDEREIDPSGDPEHLVDDLEVLRNDMFANLADDFEADGFNVPASSDTLTAHGIPYWVPWNSADAGTFTDGLPSGHTTIAGIDPTVQDKYRSWTDTYVNATRDDLGRRVSRAIRNTNWRPPEKTKGNTKVTHALYTNQTVIENNEIMAANQNDQMGFDTQPAFQKSLIARVGMTWVPLLDGSAASGSNPLYIINHAFLFPVFKKGWKFHEIPPRPAAKQPTAIEVQAYTTYNYSCPLRNRQAVVAISAPFGE